MFRKMMVRLALALTGALAVAGCPVLLEDDFEVDSVGGPDASAGGGANQGCEGCEAPRECCDGACVDVRTDRTNCGSCGVGCPGTRCEAGSCTNDCAQGFVNCDQNVVNGCEANAAIDMENCGSCGVVCALNQLCEAGTCVCPEGTANCDSERDNGCEASLASDPANCGACGVTCGVNQLCVEGECGCDDTHGDCNGDSDDGCEADLSRPVTCGACDVNCGSNSSCGEDGCACAAGFIDCDAGAPGCETPVTDPANCGSCGTQCGGGTPFCNGTDCAADCGALTVCGNSCVNTDTDSLHCGGCNQAVGENQTCVDGQPQCMPGFGDCDGAAGCETDITSDPDHCGGCDMPQAGGCKAGAVCADSACRCAASTPNDCGDECRACCDATHCEDGDLCSIEVCTGAGTCEAAGECAEGGMCCEGQGCFDCCSDDDCDSDETCSGGSCVAGCASGEIACPGGCVDPQDDPLNCGACGQACGIGRTCSMGMCTPRWVETNTTGALSARERPAYAVVGSRLFIWGGQDDAGEPLADGALYEPSTDTWTPVAGGANAPSARWGASAAYAGNFVVVWGGNDGSREQRDGARYDVVQETWLPLAGGGGVPTVRTDAHMAWTSPRVFVWGGLRAGKAVAGGGRYDPFGDNWDTGTAVGDPGALLDASSALGATVFYVFGGRPDGMGESDALYSFAVGTNTWTSLPTGPSARHSAFLSWDNTYVVVFGGISGNNTLGIGQRYHAADEVWTTVAATDAPSARAAPWRDSGWTARIASSRTLVLAGLNANGNYVRSGGIYDSTTNTWSAVPSWPSDNTHRFGAAGWVGSEMVVWGGRSTATGDPVATGERLRP